MIASRPMVCIVAICAMRRPVKRGWAIRRAGFWDPAAAVDRVVLDAGDRHRRRIVLKGERGTEFLLDLDEAVALRDGDGIMLDDGAIVLVRAGRAACSRSRRGRRWRWCSSPGISATATPTCRSSATGSASGAITCWRRWRRASAPR